VVPPVFARYRIAVDNEFRNEFSFIDYHRWGILQVWNAGRFKGPRPRHQDRNAGIDVFCNYELVNTVKSNGEGNKLVKRLLAEAPVDLSEFAHYLEL
jgi:hypothetical protein